MEKYSKSFPEEKNRIIIDKNNNTRSSSEYMRESRSYECNNGYFARKDSTYGSFIGGFSWPPRSYTCSFCKREFRSAQALGGHMNVHRRDRARLRVSSPWDATIPSSSPEPNSSNPNPNSDHKTSAAAAEEEEEEEPLPVITIPNLNHVPVVDPFLLSADTNLSLPLVPERFHQQISATTMGTTTTFSSYVPFSPSTHFIPPSKHLISSTDCSKTRPRIAMEELFYGEDRREGGRRIKVGDVRLDLKIGIHVEDLDEDLDLELRLGYT